MTTIQLSRRVSQNSDKTYRMQVWVSETTDNIPSEIFLFRKIPDVDNFTDPLYEFYSVCSYAYMINYAASGPDGSSNFYRSGGIDLDFRSISSLDNFWDTLVSDTQLLVNDIVRTHDTSGVDVSYSGTNFSVVATKKHYDDDDYSFMLDMAASTAIFVVEKQSDGEPELVSIASLADINEYSTTELDSGYYRTASITLFFSDEDTYGSTKAALDADFSDLDTELSDPGTSIEGSTTQDLNNNEIVGPTTFFFEE